MTRPFLVPETLQTSGMDCGPAALRSIFEGLGVGVNYERLREACRTSADGTSIDAMEDLCNDLGLEAFQEIAPIPDAIRILAARAPAIVVVKSASAPHFIVFWRKVGGLVQIMDPERGRRWVTAEELERSLLLHPQPFDDAMFQGWFPSTEWHRTLEARLRRLGIARPLHTLGVREAVATDAATRLLLRLLARDAVPAGAAGEVLDALIATELEAPRGALPPSLSAADWDAEGELVVRGAVFLVIRPAKHPTGQREQREDLAPLFAENPPGAFRLLARQLTPAGRRLAVFLGIAAILLALLAFAEMLFLRAAFNADALLALPQQRLAGVVLYGVLVVALLSLEALLGTWILRLGRFLELRTRIALLLKLPRLPDRYFRTRPMSDVAHRAQGLGDLKPLPEIFVTLGKQSLDVVITTAALAILHPRGIPYCVLALAFGLGVPWLGASARQQLESRQRGHASALASLYIDALFGVVPVRTHGGQPGIRALQERHLVNWRTDAERAVKLISLTEAIQSIGVLVAIVLLLLDYLGHNESQTALLLLVFWALRLPLQTRAVEATALRLSPAAASAGRLVEPLTASETMPDVEREPLDAAPEQPASEVTGVAIGVRGLGVVLGSHAVLAGVSLAVAPGEQVAIVGSSGAGKSTLLAIVLGLVEPQEGEVLIDGEPLGLYGIDRLRREAVWIDPTVQLWNRSLLHNLQFGNPAGARQPLEAVLERAALGGVVDRMPRGLATDLGEGGARVSGGEGQRVRIGRGLLRSKARLVLLDEAFRGLDRTTRRAISRSIREAAGRATVLEVTHDVADTADFDRVVVIEDGKLVEAGEPASLLATPGSRYAELVRADLGVQRGVWGDGRWRRLAVEGGTIRATSEPGPSAKAADG